MLLKVQAVVLISNFTLSLIILFHTTTFFAVTYKSYPVTIATFAAHSRGYILKYLFYVSRNVHVFMFSDNKKKIIACFKKSETFFNEGRFDLFSTCFAEGGVILPPEGPRLTDPSGNRI